MLAACEPDFDDSNRDVSNGSESIDAGRVKSASKYKFLSPGRIPNSIHALMNYTNLVG